jgi:uncharacterized protein YqgC (DUF456 family)
MSCVGPLAPGSEPNANGWQACPVHTLAVAATAVAMAVGLVGVVVPLLPGLSLIWAAALAYGLLTGFGATGWVAFTLITLLGAGAVGLKFILPQRRGRASGAPTSTLLVGAAAGVAGFFLVPVVGLILGAILGVFGAEWLRTGERAAAWRSTAGVVVGIGLATALELGAAVAMIFVWAAWVAVAA